MRTHSQIGDATGDAGGTTGNTGETTEIAGDVAGYAGGATGIVGGAVAATGGASALVRRATGEAMSLPDVAGKSAGEIFCVRKRSDVLVEDSRPAHH